MNTCAPDILTHCIKKLIAINTAPMTRSDKTIEGRLYLGIHYVNRKN